MLTAGLSTIFFIVLLGPFVNRRIERNLEGFLFLMGLMSATISNAWSSELVHEGLTAPINITLAVLAAGALFHYLRSTIDSVMKALLNRIPLAWVVCFGIVALGLLSSVISAIIAALIVVEFVTVLRLHRRAEVNLTVIACFAIGLGAALTPLGEPLSTIAVSRVVNRITPHSFYLAKLLGIYSLRQWWSLASWASSWFAAHLRTSRQRCPRKPERKRQARSFLGPLKYICSSWP